MALRYRKKRAAGPLCAGATAAAQMVAMGGLRRSDHGILPIFCWQTVRILSVVRKVRSGMLADLRYEVEQ